LDVNIESSTDSHYMAAIDMGSNSFHLVVAQLVSGEIRLIDKLAEKVMLATGLNEEGELSEEAIERGLDCLKRFAQRIEPIKPEYICCVGTNALRAAKNSMSFVSAAQKILGCRVDIVAGREEARLIYLGVSHMLADDQGKRLVIDIGGGSTEFIIGERFEPLLTESLHMGCVSYMQRFFPEGKITRRGFKQAVKAARREVVAIEYSYKALSWDSVVGSSGTAKALCNAHANHVVTDEGKVTLAGLYSLADQVLACKMLDELDIDGVKSSRRSIFPSGLAILIGIFEQLGIDKLDFSEGALREGVLYDMLGRKGHENVRERTVQSMLSRYRIDQDQAYRVAEMALQSFDQLRKNWALDDEDKELLRWSALLHELGLMMSHASFHKHSAYVLQHSDMQGFTHQSQQVLATIVGNHRRKFRMFAVQALPSALAERVVRLTLLLRLAVVLCRARNEKKLPDYQLSAKGNSAVLHFSEGWLEQHSLVADELFAEQAIWSGVEYSLQVD